MPYATYCMTAALRSPHHPTTPRLVVSLAALFIQPTVSALGRKIPTITHWHQKAPSFVCAAGTA